MCQGWRKYYCDVSVRYNEFQWVSSHVAVFPYGRFPCGHFPTSPFSHVAVFRFYIIINVESFIHFRVDEIWCISSSTVLICTGSVIPRVGLDSLVLPVIHSNSLQVHNTRSILLVPLGMHFVSRPVPLSCPWSCLSGKNICCFKLQVKLLLPLCHTLLCM